MFPGHFRDKRSAAKIRFAFRLRKAMFVLPNLFTLSSIFCGFFAVIVCTAASRTVDCKRAALAIFFGIFFDMADGRIARMTRTQSDFGVQLDSLADVLTFGLAPALLLYVWLYRPWGIGGLLLCFIYLCCGAIRLARFNVLSNTPHPNHHSYFIGLPIPLAAGTIASLVLFSAHYGLSATTYRLSIAIVVLGLSYLMISTLRYRTFKDVQALSWPGFLLTLALLLGAIFAYFIAPDLALLVYFAAYCLYGVLATPGRWLLKLYQKKGKFNFPLN